MPKGTGTSEGTGQEQSASSLSSAVRSAREITETVSSVPKDSMMNPVDGGIALAVRRENRKEVSTEKLDTNSDEVSTKKSSAAVDPASSPTTVKKPRTEKRSKSTNSGPLNDLLNGFAAKDKAAQERRTAEELRRKTFDAEEAKFNAQNPTRSSYYDRLDDDESDGSSFIASEDYNDSDLEPLPRNKKGTEAEKGRKPPPPSQEERLKANLFEQCLARMTRSSQLFLRHNRHSEMSLLASKRILNDDMDEEAGREIIRDFVIRAFKAIPPGKADTRNPTKDPPQGWSSAIPGVGFIRNLPPWSNQIIFYLDSWESTRRFRNGGLDLIELRKQPMIIYHRSRSKFADLPPFTKPGINKTHHWFLRRPRPTEESAALFESHGTGFAGEQLCADGERYRKKEIMDPVVFSVDELQDYVTTNFPLPRPRLFNADQEYFDSWTTAKQEEDGAASRAEVQELLEHGPKSLAEFRGTLSAEFGLLAMVGATIWWSQEKIRQEPSSFLNLSWKLRSFEDIYNIPDASYCQSKRLAEGEFMEDEVEFIWTPLDLDCLLGIQRDRAIKLLPWAKKAREEITLPRGEWRLRTWITAEDERVFHPPTAIGSRKDALLAVREVFEMTINSHLITHYSLPPLDFENVLEIISLCHITCPAMWYALIFLESPPFTPAKAKLNRALREKKREAEEIARLMLEIAYLPWSTDADGNTAVEPCSKWDFAKESDLLLVGGHTMSDVGWKTIQLQVFDALHCEQLEDTRLQGRVSGALWRIAIDRYQRVLRDLPDTQSEVREQLTGYVPMKTSLTTWLAEAEKKLFDQHRDKEATAASSTGTSTAGTAKSVTPVAATIDATPAVTPAAAATVIVRQNTIVINDQAAKDAKLVSSDNRIQAMTKDVLKLLDNHLLACAQAGITPNLANIFIPKFDEKVWDVMSAKLLLVNKDQFSTEQIGYLEKGTILAYKDKPSILVETLKILYQQQEGLTEQFLSTKTKICQTFEAVSPRTNTSTLTKHCWQHFFENLCTTSVDLREKYPNESWTDQDYKESIFATVMDHWKDVCKQKPHDHQEMAQIILRFQDQNGFFNVFSNGTLPKPQRIPKTMRDFTITLDMLGDEATAFAKFHKDGSDRSKEATAGSGYKRGNYQESATANNASDGAPRTRKDKRAAERLKKKSAVPQQSSTPAAKAPTTAAGVSTLCSTCGKVHKQPCFHVNHPDRNASSSSWADSANGKKWKAAGYDTLRPNYRLNGDPWNIKPPTPAATATTTTSTSSTGNGGQGQAGQKSAFAGKRQADGHGSHRDNKRKKGKYDGNASTTTVSLSEHVSEHSNMLALLNQSTTTEDRNNPDYLMPALIAIPSLSNSPTPLLLQAKCLLDSGAIRFNYMSQDLATRLERIGSKPHSRCAHVVNSALSSNSSTKRKRCGECTMSECGTCAQVVPAVISDDKNNRPDVCTDSTTSDSGGVTVNQCHDIKLMLLTNKTRRRELFITFSVIESPFDLIIGRQDICKYDLTKYCREYFVTTKTLQDTSNNPVPPTASDSHTMPVDYSPIAKTQQQYSEQAYNDDTVAGLTILPDLPSGRPDIAPGMLKAVRRERSHQIHTAVHMIENEATLKRRDSLRHELKLLRDRRLVTATCRGGQCCTTPQGPSGSSDWKSRCNPCSRGLVLDSRFKATRDIHMGPCLNSFYDTTDMSYETTLASLIDVDSSSSHVLPTKLSDFVGEEGNDPFDDMLEAVDNSIHYPPDQPLKPEDSLPNLKNTVFEGDEESTRQLYNLLVEFQDIISKGYKKEPARVAPMELHVDLSQWETRQNSQRVRPQSLERETELRKQLDKLEQAGIIEKRGVVQFWSQVLLVKKPHDDASTGERLWRFCVDYVNLNRASKPEKWPLPKIDELLQQIGQARPTVFAKIDLTHGFHQMMLAAAAMHFTAFIVAFGIYVWKRVPMGLKGAPGYFQGQMQIVLGALLMMCCALYIDDILIWGKTNAELLVNLRLVFERLRLFNITIHPDKIFVGLKQLEFIGHTIDAEGLHFSQAKIDKVFQIPIPVYDSEMKSFLGLAQYFSDHVQDFAKIACPLHELIKQYDKRKKKRLNYTQEALDAFEFIKNSINNCSKLYFHDPSLPIYLATDASDIACGAYLYQIKDRKQIPIRFWSQKFSATEKRWATPHKEAYALYMGVMTFEYLLRDQKFIIKTDHKNLVFLSESENAKVVRWKIALQAFDATIEYIEGPRNVVADALSRLVPADDLEKFTVHLAAMYLDRPILATLEPETVSPEPPQAKPSHWKLNSDQQWVRESVPPQVESSAQAPLSRRVRKRQAVSAAQKHRTRPTANIIINGEVQQGLAPYERRAMRDLRPVNLPPEIRELLIRVHNSIVGHHGVERMLQMLAELGHNWPYMRAHVHMWVEQCALCQKMSYIKSPIVARHFTTASYEPMERLNIDHVGPYPIDEDGNQYLLVIIDCFTRWLELYPVKSVDAATTADALLKHFGRFGCPIQLVSDKGSGFVNELIKEFTKLLDFEWAYTLQYSKEENAIVERSNKEVLRHLRAIVNHRKVRSRWSKMTPFVQRIFNATVKQSLGLSPGRLLFGNNIRLDTNIFHFPKATDGHQTERPLSEWVDEKLNLQQLAVEIAQSTQLTAEHKRFEKEGPRTPTTFPDGSFVLVEDPPSTHKQKLLLVHNGPYEVVGHHKDHYSIRNLITNQVIPIHLGRLRPFNYDRTLTVPHHIAELDDQEFRVEKILEHRGSHKNKTKMMFLVKWEGYDANSNSWEPWYDSTTGAGVRDNAMLHQYLRDHNWEKLIPKTQLRANAEF